MSRLTKPIKPKRLKSRTEARTVQIRSLLAEGLRHRSAGRADKALKAFDSILRMEPENTDALFMKCQVFFEQQQYSRALHLLQRCLRSKSKNPQLLYIVAYHYHQLKRYDKAVKLLTAALDRNPGLLIARLLLAKIHADIGREAKGRELLTGIEGMLSERPTELITYANVLGELHLYEQCSQALRDLLKTPEMRVEALRDVVLWLPATYWDTEFQSILYEQLAKPNHSIEDQVRLHFTAGRVAEVNGRYEEAFRHFKSGNDLSEQSFDLDVMEQTAARLRKVFHDQFDFRSFEPQMKQVMPVFIIGMPRSGKTSLENQLSSHPEIAAGKELDLRMYIDDEMIVRLQGRLPNSFEKDVETFSIQKRKTYARAYLDEVLPGLLRDDLPKIVTNTLPLNFQNVGFIKLILPNAKFIHITRHPADTCWFCYSKNFKNEYTFTNSLDVLGKYFSIYSNLCEHWATVLPDDWLNVSYETLVSDTEATRRRVFEFVGLNDDESGSVASGTETILTDKYIGYWKHYEDQLRPLLNELEDLT